MRFPRVLTLVVVGTLAAACDSTDPSNAAPAAGFTVECDQLECSFESSSTDADGAITAYAWDFGDEGSSTEPNPTHAYAAPGGDFTVRLTVTDDDGAAAIVSRQVSVSVGNGGPVAAGQIAFVRDGRIIRVNTDGSGMVQLSEGPGDQDPAWSSDGQRIAFTRTGGETPGVFLMDADGSNLVQRTTSGSNPTWSPDGVWIAFLCEGVCQVRADDGTNAVDVITPLTGNFTDPAWSPDGTRIVFGYDWGSDYAVHLNIVGLDSSPPAPLRSTLENLNTDEYQPAWSPDGRRIAYVACPWSLTPCRSSAVMVISASGTQATQVATTTGHASPSWSPDGRMIAFSSSNAILWVSADGRRYGRIVDDGDSPAWRP
jgi:Tol biopolymer transport system component